ncbi:TIGR02206 family membrane protein [Oceanobacillus bengalensis]|uniref:TIGR02206 family membrane protein n=1 Tax=Oceanobacillus bengalensis TaxID=1435466 RepID=A0A494YT87_9BACI|nr:TIGR02206 family membrane protein [Oceanobacillus bengalensis]RKQ13320.1 TIGR02206 family membrane protein [Oceanobacillus bengalensis]
MSWWSEDTAYIQILSIDHIIYLFILAISLAVLILYRNKVKRNRKQIAACFLILSILQQILLYSWYIFETGFDVSESLPLQICRISTLLGIWFLVTKNIKVLEIMFYFGLFAYGSFLYPSRIHPVYHVMGISFVVNHVITILLPYFGYIAYQWRPKFKGFLKAYLLFLVYFAFVYVLNPFIDGNYFYLKYRPFFNEWPNYIYVPVVLIVVFIGFYLAFVVVRSAYRISSKQEKMDERFSG